MNVKKYGAITVACLLLSVMLMVSGCATKDVMTVSEPGQAASPADGEGAAVKAESAATGKVRPTEPGKVESEAIVQAVSPSEVSRFESEKIFFDFDRYDLKPDAREILMRKAVWLQDHPKFSLRIEGHCDEQGTSEYNLALGQRRAEAAKAYLASLGISPDRLIAVSYGEMQPAAQGHDEDAWAQNRRDEFYLVK